MQNSQKVCYHPEKGAKLGESKSINRFTLQSFTMLLIISVIVGTTIFLHSTRSWVAFDPFRDIESSQEAPLLSLGGNVSLPRTDHFGRTLNQLRQIVVVLPPCDSCTASMYDISPPPPTRTKWNSGTDATVTVLIFPNSEKDLPAWALQENKDFFIVLDPFGRYTPLGTVLRAPIAFERRGGRLSRYLAVEELKFIKKVPHV